MKIRSITLAFAAACAAFGAQASEVSLYGVLDTALTWQYRGDVAGTDSSSVKMMSGQYIGSRFGMKGEETLASGLKVGFVLENGYSTDAGTLGQDGRLFGRDARLYLDGDFGYLSFGRMGSMVGGNGPYARFGHVVSPFSCGWGFIGGHLQVVSLGFEFIDNAIAYTTPVFAGLDATVQYSFGTDSKHFGDGTEGKSSVERLLSGAVRYRSDNLMVAFGIETINQAQPAADHLGLDDAISYNLGANYNAGWAKFFFYTQVFENYKSAAKTTTFSLDGGVDGYGVNVGVEIPAFGGAVKAGIGYGDFEGSREKKRTMDTIQAALGYTYSLSRRTTFYTAGGWIKSDYSKEHELKNPQAVEDAYEFTFGLVHKF